MPAPGYTVTIGDIPATNYAEAEASNAFIAGPTHFGPTDEAVLVVSVADFENKMGPIIEGYPTMYHSIRGFFAEGGAAAYIGREVGSTAVVASDTTTIKDTGGKVALKAKAASAGTWGNDLKLVFDEGTGDFTIAVYYDGTLIDTSPALDDQDAAITWAAANVADYVYFELGAAESTIPKDQTTELKSGVDNFNAVSTGTLETALATFNKDLGPGQVLAPGRTAEAAQKLLMAHADANNRRAIPDSAAGSAAEVAAEAAALADETGARFSAMVAPHAVIPGLSRGSEVTIPYSPILAGQIARAEGRGFQPNQAAAGKARGLCEFAIGLSRTYTEAELATLNEAGVIAAKLKRGVPVTYGNVTLVDVDDDPDWKSWSGSRQVMWVAARAGEVLENYEFEQIDGHGLIFKKLQGDLSNIACMPAYQANALYGTTPEAAFGVNVGPDVNTPTSIENEEIKAQIALRVSNVGERLSVEIVKVPTSESL